MLGGVAGRLFGFLFKGLAFRLLSCFVMIKKQQKCLLLSEHAIATLSNRSGHWAKM